MRFYDLFGGIGGFRLGLEKRIKCVGYCDLDKWATAVYNYRFDEEYRPTDIRQVDTDTIPEHDVLCAGFPWLGRMGKRGVTNPHYSLSLYSFIE